VEDKVIYLAGLNGIRAIAALAVLVHHITLQLPDFNLNPHVFGTFADGTPRSLDLAGYGVTMFFTLSGFLITYLLCVEKEKGVINVKKFYVRRILRIWPLYYIYIFIVVITFFIFSLSYNSNSIVYYIFLSANIPFITGKIIPLLSHYWSLGVEEQFYIFWPWINRFKKKHILAFSFTLIIVFVLLKLYLHFFIPGSIIESIINVNRFHCMLIGALGAIYYLKKHSFFITFLTLKTTQLIAWVIIFLVSLNFFHVASVIDNEIISIVTLIIIVGQITKKGIISLENRYFDFLGKISFGIYVIHPLVIFIFSMIFHNNGSNNTIQYILVYFSIIFSTIFMSYISYEYFEKKFIRLKTAKYTVIKSSGSFTYK
jgi:peptidoglycan/LPS O-acetylase OafA/YrhL